jgi:hypothetical protein
MQYPSIARAIVEWGVFNLPRLVTAVKDEAPQGGTRQLAMFSGRDAATTLKGSIRGRTRGTATKLRMEILSGVSYAIIVRDGHGIITPKKAKVLHWVDADGNDVFRMSVGPVAANPFPKRGYAKVGPEIKADLRRRVAAAALNELIQTAKKGGMHA